MRVLAQGGNIPGEKRERRSPSSEGFHSRLINWQITVNYRAGKLYKGYSIQLPLPLFFPGFSFALSVSVSPDSSASLYALHVTVDFSSRSSLVVFLLSVSTSFARTRFSHFTPGLLLSTLSLHFLRVVFLFFLPLHRLHQFFFLSIVLPSPLFTYGRPFSAGFPFFLRDAFCFFPTLYGRSRIQNAFSRGKSGGTHNYTYAPGLPASASPVRKTWKQVRYTQPRRTPRRQTARHGSTSHLHIAVTPLPGHGGNNTRVFF